MLTIQYYQRRMKEKLITGLEKYLDRKNLRINIDKMKVMRFKKGSGRKKKLSARQKVIKLEEVKEFEYLGFTMQANRELGAHIWDRIRKTAGVMRQIWAQVDITL